MRKKALLLWITVLFLSMAVPVAHAEPSEPSESVESSDPLSPGRGGGQTIIQSEDLPLLELPTFTISVKPLASSSGGPVMPVPAEQMMEAIEPVTSGDAVSITIAANHTDGASSVSTVIPWEGLAAVAENTGAEMSVVSDLGQVTFSHAAIASIVEEPGDITVAMARKTDGTEVEIDVLSGDTRITDREGIFLGTSAEQPVVVSPLAAQREDIHYSEGAPVRTYAAYLCAAAVLALAGGIIAGVVTKRRQKHER